MTTDDLRKTAGFTLVELMIVVAVIAVLSAIAINNFYAISRRSKISEVFTNLGIIRTGQESYRAEHAVYIAAGAWPAATPAASGELWEDPAVPTVENTNFKLIGFAVDGVVRYRYTVTIVDPGAGTPPYYSAIANGDLDDDGLDAEYRVSNDPAEILLNAAGDTADAVYPKAILIEQDSSHDDF